MYNFTNAIAYFIVFQLWEYQKLKSYTNPQKMFAVNYESTCSIANYNKHNRT